MTDAERVREALRTMFEDLYEVFDGARFERRGSYDFLFIPQIPVAQFNGAWPHSDAAASELEGAIAEVEAAGVPSSVQLRRELAPGCEAEAKRLGLTKVLEMPVMVVREAGLLGRDVDELMISTVSDDDDRRQAVEVAAAGFGAPAAIFEPIYGDDVLALEGVRVYLGRFDDQVVTTAIGYTAGDSVGIFNVATPAEHRGRGYGAAVTTAAARGGFDAGAELACLQSSELGRSVYRGLGFEEVATDVLLTR
jgi:hypothetical protein